MSQVKPNALIESLSGSLCSHSDMYFFRKNGKVFTGKRCHPYKGEPTANQLAQRQKFATARTNAKAALADPEKKAAYLAAFKSQHRYCDFNGYVFAQEYAALND